MWVTWVNCKLIEDMMVVNDVVKFHENRMQNEGDAYTRLKNYTHTDMLIAIPFSKNYLPSGKKRNIRSIEASRILVKP